jgi:hypothetical protein
MQKHRMQASSLKRKKRTILQGEQQKLLALNQKVTQKLEQSYI